MIVIDKMDWNSHDFAPIKKSTPIKNIVITVSQNKYKNQTTMIIPIHTNNTIKKNASYNIDTNRMRYDSHHHRCSMCHENPKTISKRYTNFYRYLNREIDESIYGADNADY